MTASLEHCLFCFDTLVAHLSEAPSLRGPDRHPAFDNVKCPLFVTWNKSSPHHHHSEPRLRGCIGTLDPKPLHTSLKDYALTSALHDRRFPPITRTELPHLSCTVSLLADFEGAAHQQDWEIGTHGLLMEFTDPATGARRTATFLPEVALHQRWSQLETLEQLVRKGGYAGDPADVLSPVSSTGNTSSRKQQYKLMRYRSTTCTLSYHDYLHQARVVAERGGGSLGTAAAGAHHAKQAPFPGAGAAADAASGAEGSCVDAKPRGSRCKQALVTVPA